jgi:aspartyl-tRNA(Asn)/glutamyl-tRNA(Gln) amidotransferase subunit C
MLTDEDLDRIARIARLRLTAGERKRLQRELDSILGMIEQMREADVSNVDPLTHINNRNQRLRIDAPSRAIDRDRLMANAPEKEDNLFTVPKVIE